MKEAYRRPPVRAVDNPALGRTRPRLVLRSPDLGVGHDVLRKLPFAAGRLVLERGAQPRRFRASHLAQDPDPDRTWLCACAIRLGWACRNAGSAGRVGDRHRLDVDVPDQGAGEGLRYRCPHPRERSLSAMFKQALPDAAINLDSIVIALAAFERTIEPAEAPFDRWIAGDERRFRKRRNAASFCSTARPIARAVTADGASPTTSSMTSEPRRPIGSRPGDQGTRR